LLYHLFCPTKEENLDMARRLIGITGGYRQRTTQRADEFYLLADYFDSVDLAGGLPVLIPQISNDETLRDLLGRLDGLVIPGGPDTPPARYGQPPHPRTQPVHTRQDEFDFRCLGAALDLGLPILAICYGAQLLNVFLGGTLVQDIPSQRPSADRHVQDGPRLLHPVRIEPGTKLARCLGVTELEANSCHHQAVDRLGRGLRVSARSRDGIIEGIETEDDRFILAVQWHPEELAAKRPDHLKLFQAIVRS
jgi:putative glutamine amidotransferase